MVKYAREPENPTKSCKVATMAASWPRAASFVRQRAPGRKATRQHTPL